MRETTVSVSIVIPCYNEEAVIGSCLESCLDQTVPADEIVIVNNKSTDKTVEIVQHYQKQHPGANIVLLHQNEVQGLIPTRNFGFQEAKGDILGRIDADSMLTREWVAEVKKTFADPDVAAATGPVIYHDMPAKEVGGRADERIRRVLHRISSNRDHRFLFGSNMAIRKSVWEVVGPETCPDYDDLMHEDIDIALHLYQHGAYIAYNKHMVGGMSARRLDDSPRKFYNYIMRFERTFKHHGVKSAAARIPIFIYLSTYFPLKMIRRAYDSENDKLSLARLTRSLTEEEKLAGGGRVN